jgi:hypothetical protein
VAPYTSPPSLCRRTRTRARPRRAGRSGVDHLRECCRTW